MDPLFLLPQQPAPIFGRTTNFEYKKCLPDSVFQSFAPTGRHTFRWQNQAGEWWVPSQSYLRIRFAFCAVKEDGTGLRPINTEDGVAPVMNLPPHLFSRMEYYMDGNKLSELQDYVPQIDTMKHRMMKSRAYMSAVGNRACFWHPDFAARQKLITPILGGAVNTSLSQSGDITGQRIVVRDSKIYKSGGVAHDTAGFVDSGCFFGQVYDSSTFAPGVGETRIPADVIVYGATVCETGAPTVRSLNWDGRLTALDAYGYDPLTGIGVSKQVLLTLKYNSGFSKSMIATWTPCNDLYWLHKSTQQYDPLTASATSHISAIISITFRPFFGLQFIQNPGLGMKFWQLLRIPT